MSKGNPTVIVRLPFDLSFQIAMAVETANLTRREEPYNTSSWIRSAIQEKLAKLKRGRKKSVKKVLLNS